MACVSVVGQSRLLVQDCAAKLEGLGLRGAIQEVSMIKVRCTRSVILCSKHTRPPVGVGVLPACPYLGPFLIGGVRARTQ